MDKRFRSISLHASGLTVREMDGEEESRMIEGHAVVFGQRSLNLTPWSSQRAVFEIMEPGSITQDLIDKSDVVLTAFHSDKLIMGRSKNGQGTLGLSLDKTGLLVRCELPKTNTADDMLELIKRGDITGMSFCYTADEEDANSVAYERTEEKTEDGKEVWIRRVKKCNGLYDVTIAGHPAYEQTDISTREMADDVEKHIASAVEETERQNREADEAAEQAKREKELMDRQRRIAQLQREIEITSNFS